MKDFFVILNIRSENFIFTKNCTVITTFKYDNVFDEMLGYWSKFVYSVHSSKKNVIPHLDMCYIRLFFHLLIFSIFYIMYWFSLLFSIWMKFLYYVKYFLKRHDNKIDIVYEPWIEFTYVKSFYVKCKMCSFMRSVSFRVSGTRLSMLADKNNKWIWLEKNIIDM